MASFTDHRIVVLGYGGVGKSDLTSQYILNHCGDGFPTTEDSYRKQIDLDGKLALLDVLDTGAQVITFQS